MFIFVTILKVLIHQRKWAGWRKTNIATSKYISLTQTNLAMTTGKTEWFVEIPAFATINLQLHPLANPINVRCVPASVRNIGISQDNPLFTSSEAVAELKSAIVNLTRSCIICHQLHATKPLRQTYFSFTKYSWWKSKQKPRTFCQDAYFTFSTLRQTENLISQLHCTKKPTSKTRYSDFWAFCAFQSRAVPRCRVRNINCRLVRCAPCLSKPA